MRDTVHSDDGDESPRKFPFFPASLLPPSTNAMPRTRLIRPGFFKDADLYDAEVASGLPLRVAFAGLWTVTDREGRFVWKPREIKPDVLPHDPVDLAAVLDALEKHGFVQRYVVDSKSYGLIPSFKDHQTFHKTEPPSQLPAPGGPPLPHRETTVVSPEDSVAVAVRDADINELRVEGDAVRAFAIALCSTANAAARQKWRSEPYLPGSVPSFTTAQELIEAGIPLPAAQGRLVTQIESSALASPPRTLRYFLPGCMEANTVSHRRRGGVGQRSHDNALAALKDIA